MSFISSQNTFLVLFQCAPKPPLYSISCNPSYPLWFCVFFCALESSSRVLLGVEGTNILAESSILTHQLSFLCAGILLRILRGQLEVIGFHAIYLFLVFPQAICFSGIYHHSFLFLFHLKFSTMAFSTFLFFYVVFVFFRFYFHFLLHLFSSLFCLVSAFLTTFLLLSLLYLYDLVFSFMHKENILSSDFSTY